MPRKNAVEQAPCHHYDRLVGTVSAGDYDDMNSPFLSVVTCADCATASSEYVAVMTERPANPLLTYAEARKAHAA